MSQRLRKVVFPVAGLGTRFLPVTKAVAKEMLPVLDRPLIQYAVDEAVDAGADTLIFVTNRYKHAIADYFDKAYELEDRLEEKGKEELLAMVKSTLPDHVRAVFVTQPEALGLGHAVLCAKPVVGDDVFGVMLPDDLIVNDGPGALRQMADLAASRPAGGGVIAVEQVPADQTHKYGIVDTSAEISDRARRISHLVEKPDPAEAPSDWGVVGRYVLPASIFDLLEKTTPGAGGEIQLTDAIETLLKQHDVLAYRFAGQRFDCGNKRGLVRATCYMAAKDPELAPVLREILKEALS